MRFDESRDDIESDSRRPTGSLIALSPGILISILVHLLVLLPLAYFGAEHLLDSQVGVKDQVLDLEVFYQSLKNDPAFQNEGEEIKEVSERSPQAKALDQKNNNSTYIATDLSLQAIENEAVVQRELRSAKMALVSELVPEADDVPRVDRNAGLFASAEKEYLRALLLRVEEIKSSQPTVTDLDREHTVKIFLLIRNDGSFEDVRVHKSSGDPRVDRAGIKLIKSMKRFKPFPNKIKRELWDLAIPVTYVS